MRVKKISAFVLAMVLCLSPFTLFSFAVDSQSVMDSGSPEVSLMVLRSIASDDGISLAAAEGNSGQFGYNIEPYPVELVPTLGTNNDTYFNYGFTCYLQPGTYSFNVDFNSDFFRFLVVDVPSQTVLIRATFVGNSYSDYFTVSEYTQVYLYGAFYHSNSSVSDISMLDYSLFSLTPIDGISSGYTYSSGIIPKTTRSIFGTLTPSFGNHPAGKYLVNIYHWGDSYDVKFHISDSTESYYLPTSTNGGVTTLVFNHPGGAFTLDGSFTASNVETSVVDGDVDFNGSSSYGYLVADGPLSWVFNITDIVAIPYEQAADSNFGLFSPIIGFFRDQFSYMKSWIATQIDKIAGDDETKADVDNAKSELDKEVQELNNLSSDFNSYASNIEQQMTTDFAVPDDISGQSGNVQTVFSALFGSFGVFTILFWLPPVLAVIKHLLRL